VIHRSRGSKIFVVRAYNIAKYQGRMMRLMRRNLNVTRFIENVPKTDCRCAPSSPCVWQQVLQQQTSLT